MTCSHDGCTNPVFARGWCSAHWQAWRRSNPPDLLRKAPNGATHKFCEEVLKAETDECIEWPYGQTGCRYPVIYVSGKQVQVTNYLLEKSGQPRPTPKHVAAHKPVVCHDPRCVNLRHLRWATTQENAADRLLDGTEPRLGKAPGTAKLSVDQVRAIRSDSRARKDIAAEYGVDYMTVSNIQRRISYAWLA